MYEIASEMSMPPSPPSAPSSRLLPAPGAPAARAPAASADPAASARPFDPTLYHDVHLTAGLIDVHFRVLRPSTTVMQMALVTGEPFFAIFPRKGSEETILVRPDSGSVRLLIQQEIAPGRPLPLGRIVSLSDMRKSVLASQERQNAS